MVRTLILSLGLAINTCEASTQVVVYDNEVDLPFSIEAVKAYQFQQVIEQYPQELRGQFSQRTQERLGEMVQQFTSHKTRLALLTDDNGKTLKGVSWFGLMPGGSLMLKLTNATAEAGYQEIIDHLFLRFPDVPSIEGKVPLTRKPVVDLLHKMNTETDAKLQEGTDGFLYFVLPRAKKKD